MEKSEPEKALVSENWNQRYVDGDTPWDKGAPSPALQEVIESGSYPQDAEVLVIGCGYGHDVRELAEAGYQATGIDISVSAIAGAKLAGKGTNAKYEVADLFDPEFAGQKCYDAIWEHTCFCAILPEQRDDYVEAVYRLLKPGGVLTGVFFAFADAGSEEEGPPFKTTVETLHRHFEKRFVIEWEHRPEQFFPAREGAEWLMCWRRR